MPIRTFEQIVICYYCYCSSNWRHSTDYEAGVMLVETHHLKSRVEANGGGIYDDQGGWGFGSI